MSVSVVVVLCALLIVAGGVTIFAAAMGNPVRIGRLRVPGPEGAIERAVIGVVGAVCVAAVLPVVLMNQGLDSQQLTAAHPTGTPEPPAVTSPKATASPTPPAGPSAVAAPPGVPTVTSISVTPDAATGCVRTFAATVHISTGPVTVRYRVYVNGAVVGEPNRTKSVNGTGGRLLDAVQVTATHSGAWTVRVDVLGPNPNLLTGTSVWTAPAACDPAPPASPSPTKPPPTLSISGLNAVGFPASTDPCSNPATINVSSTLTVGSAPSGLSVTYTIQVDTQSAGFGPLHVDGSAQLNGSVVLTTVTNGQKITVAITATAAEAAPASTSQDYTITCT